VARRGHDFGNREFKINAVGDDERNRLLRIFDVTTDLASRSPLTSTRINSKGVETTEPYFKNIGRLRAEVFAEPTDLYVNKLLQLSEMLKGGMYTPQQARKTLQNIGYESKKQMDRYRYGTGLEIHHGGALAAAVKGFGHLPIEIQGQHLARYAEKAKVGSTPMTQDFSAYINGPEHDAAHFAPVTGVANKGDVVRNLGRTQDLYGDELIDHMLAVSGIPSLQLAQHADEFSQDTRLRYLHELEKLGVQAKVEELGSPIARREDKISASQRIFNDTKKLIGIEGMNRLTAKINREAYPDGLNSIIKGAEKVNFSTPAAVGKRLGAEERAVVEKMRSDALVANTEGIQLHPGSREEMDEAIQLRKLIDFFGVKEDNNELSPKVFTFPTSRMVKDETKSISDKSIMESPSRMAGTNPEAARALEIASGKRTDSPGESKERALVISNVKGNVSIGEDVLRSNGNGKHKNGNGH